MQLAEMHKSGLVRTGPARVEGGRRRSPGWAVLQKEEGVLEGGRRRSPEWAVLQEEVGVLEEVAEKREGVRVCVLPDLQ
jgi:hypothetical protein